MRESFFESASEMNLRSFGRDTKDRFAEAEDTVGGGVGGAVVGDGWSFGIRRGEEEAVIESGFAGVETRGDVEALGVGRAFKDRAADAMAETAPFSPGFFQHAIESFQGELATVF